MPGHAGRPVGAFIDPVLPYDVTELADTDSLYDPCENGGVRASFEKAKKLFGTSETIFFGCRGDSGFADSRSGGHTSEQLAENRL